MEKRLFFTRSLLSCLSSIFIVLSLGGLSRADESWNNDKLAFEPATIGQPIVHTSHGLDNLFVDPPTTRGQQARGLYFNGPLARKLGAAGLMRIIRGAGLDAVVIDVKDGEGRVFYDTQIEVLQPQKRPFARGLSSVVSDLKAAGIYTIARVVCFSDPKLPRNYPDRAILDGRPGKLGQLWANWKRRNTWLDPFNRANHDLLVDIAKEIEALGFDELQLDYFRFPVDEATAFAVYPAKVESPKQEVLLNILKRIDAAIDIPIGVDVFGVTAFQSGDPEGLGQSLETLAAHVEVFSPMLYLNSMRQWLTGQKQQRALRLVQTGVTRLRRRLGHGPIIRPFLQAYPKGADYYTPDFIAEQIAGSRQGGADGFLFWHPDSDYSMVRAAMAGPAHALSPFPIDQRLNWRRENYGERLPEPPAPSVKTENTDNKIDTQDKSDTPDTTHKAAAVNALSNSAVPGEDQVRAKTQQL
jgi:hypothetical protein